MLRKPFGLTSLFAITVIAALRGATADPFAQPLPPARQIEHVLNRLAYGPRPGDVEEVKRVGVQQWVAMQLHPQRLVESTQTRTHLQPLETIPLPTWQLFEKYQVLVATRVALEQLLPAVQAMKLQTGTPEEKRHILSELTGEQKRQVLIALPAAAMKDLSDIQAEAFNARRLDEERRRKQRPPLMDLITEEQMQVLFSGTDDQKTQLLAGLDAEKRLQVLRAAPAGSLPVPLRREAMAVNGSGQLPLVELIDAKVYRAVYSTHQLEEVLVDFWLNHFNVFSGKGPIRMLLTSYERDAIRPHVFGRFRDMLLATARHPAMLYYLDNWQSQTQRTNGPGSGLNENYGRELMELHTLGVDGGYTQSDVVNVARAFTGWTIHEPNRYGEFFFNPATHDRDEKVMLGHTLPRSGGEDDGVKVIDLLSRHPSTAKFIARKLAQRFVSDSPPQALVDRVAATFMKTDGDLRAVMESLLLSKEFLSDGAWHSKIKSPMELVFSALRALDADVTETMPLAQRLADLGQPLYGKLEPTGYPNTTEMWVSSASILARIDFAAALTSGKIPGVTIRRDAMPGGDLQRATVLVASPEFQQR